MLGGLEARPRTGGWVRGHRAPLQTPNGHLTGLEIGAASADAAGVILIPEFGPDAADNVQSPRRRN